VVQVRLFSLEDFPGTRPGGFANPDLTHLPKDPSPLTDSVVRPPIGLYRINLVTEY
jgi:hypothetical protein